MACVTRRGLKDGSTAWNISVYCGNSPDGRKIMKYSSYRGSKKKALARARELEAERDAGTLIVEKITVSALLDDVLADYKIW